MLTIFSVPQAPINCVLWFGYGLCMYPVVYVLLSPHCGNLGILGKISGGGAGEGGRGGRLEVTVPWRPHIMSGFMLFIRVLTLLVPSSQSRLLQGKTTHMLGPFPFLLFCHVVTLPWDSPVESLNF